MRARSRWETATLVWAIAACAYVFFLPVSNNIVLMPLVASIGVLALYWFVSRGVRVHARILLPAAIWTAFVLYGSITAGLFGAESWLRVMVFMIAIPLFYFLVVSVFRREFIRPLLTVGLVVSTLVALLLISQMLVAMGLLTFLELPEPAAEFINLRVAVDPNGPLRFTTNVLPPMLWWGAMWMASIFVKSSDAYLPPMALRVIASIVCLSAAVFSLRRALIVALVVTPLVMLGVAIVLFFKNRAQRDIRFSWRNALTLIGALAVAAAIVLAVQPKSYEIVNASLKSIIAVTTNNDVVLEGPTPTPGAESEGEGEGEGEEALDPIEEPLVSDGSNLGIKGTYDTVRQNESRILLTPADAREALVGRGLGATVDRGSYFREDLKDRPWQSDLPYHLVFYWTGYLGVALVLAVVVTGALGLRFAMRRAGDLNGVLFVATVGAIALLVANASNPYIQALGHAWPLFFPFMIANAILAQSTTGANGLVIPPWLGLRRAKPKP